MRTSETVAATCACKSIFNHARRYRQFYTVMDNTPMAAVMLFHEDYDCENTVSTVDVNNSEVLYTENRENDDTVPVNSSTTVLANDSCKITLDLEVLFLKNNNFRIYDTTRDLNIVPTVLHSRVLDQHYVCDHNNVVSFRDLNVFEKNGHSLTIDNNKSYVRPFALDLDCAVCHSGKISNRPHQSEETVTGILVDVRRELKSIDKTAITSVWNLNCGYHIYSNIMVSLTVHNQICDMIQSKYMNDPSVIIEVPVFMPLPHSAKKRQNVYKQTILNDSELNIPVCCGITDYYYYDNCVIHSNLREDYTVILEMITSFGIQYMSRVSKTRKVQNTIPNILSVDSFEPKSDYQNIDKIIAYVDGVLQSVRSIQISNGVIMDDAVVAVDHDRLYSDVKCMDIIIDFRTSIDDFFKIFNKNCFGTDLNSIFIDEVAIFDAPRFVNCVFDKFIYHSAVQFGGLNLQHYIIAFHKSFKKNIESASFKYLIKTLYADVDDTSVKHFVDNYDAITLSAYPDNFEFILNYMRIYICDGVTPSMDASDVFDRVLCTRLQTRDPQIFQAALEVAKKKYTIINKFVVHLINVCKEYRFFLYFGNTLYALNNSMFYYDTVSSLPFMLNWTDPHITSRITPALLKRIETKFEVDTFCESNEYMVATSVGLFNTITGLYASRTSLVPFIKGRHRVVWPVDRPLRSYDRQNIDILSNRSTVNRVVNILRHDVDNLYVKFQFLPSVVGLCNTWDINNTAICEFFEIVQEHKDLPDTLPVVELYPFNTRFVAFVLVLLNEYGLRNVCEYRHLCREVFGYSVKHTEVTAADWLSAFRVKFKLDFKPDDEVDAGDTGMFKITDTRRPYAERLQSFCAKGVSIEIGEREAVLGVTFVAAMVKCSQFKLLCTSFGHKHLPEPSKHFDVAYMKLSFEPNLENFQNFYTTTINTLMKDPKDQFERMLMTMIVQMCISTTFNPVAVREALNIYSTLVLPVNVLKKIYILHGAQNKGKSYMLDILMEMVQPSVHALNDLEAAQNRSGLASTALMLRCNELKTLHPGIVKSLTGNDPVSRQVFFSQKFILHMGGQAILFAATNVAVEFTESKKKENRVDRATVNRFHTLSLSGSLIQEHAMIDSDSVFAMTANRNFFTPIMKISKMDSAKALQWLTYENYMMTRINYRPYINENFQDSLNYRHMLYRNNCIIYDFICQCGFIEENGFYMKSDVLLRVVSRDFIKNNESVTARGGVNMNSDYGRITLHRKTFIQLFNQHYQINVEKTMHIKDVQFKELIDHIKSNMDTEVCVDGAIYEEEVDRRLNVYTSDTDKANAKNYFKRNTGPLGPIYRYDNVEDFDNGPKRRSVCCIVGYRFVNSEPESYDLDKDSDAENDEDDTGTVASAGSFVREDV